MKASKLKTPLLYFIDDAIRETDGLPDWRVFAKQLPLNAFKMKKIEHLKLEDKEAKSEVFMWWVERDRYPSMMTIIEILKNLQFTDMADKIEEKYYGELRLVWCCQPLLFLMWVRGCRKGLASLASMYCLHYVIAAANIWCNL